MTNRRQRLGSAKATLQRLLARNPYPQELERYPDYLLRDMGFDPCQVRGFQKSDLRSQT